MSNGQKNKLSTDYLETFKFNFYLFETTDTETPTCCADMIYVLCKYLEEGKFKPLLSGKKKELESFM
jgi:hypothetical protein